MTYLLFTYFFQVHWAGFKKHNGPQKAPGRSLPTLVPADAAKISGDLSVGTGLDSTVLVSHSKKLYAWRVSAVKM